jgi:hypothetical protein
METIFEKTEETVVSLVNGMLKSMDEDLKGSWSEFRDLLIGHEEFDTIRHEPGYKGALLMLCEMVDVIQKYGGVGREQTKYSFEEFMTGTLCNAGQIKQTDLLIRYIDTINDKDLALDGDYPEQMHMLGGMLRLVRTLQGCLARTDKFKDKV